ncbi:mitochondrial 54S ribosomal protein bL33m [Limtongia smithiae]|uniref:mitochondrial 54S ribosomal protein bL33m n=1 Tax=Limtongia smithiae TaxID=1125753 RepID=UPI0034CD9F31
MAKVKNRTTLIKLVSSAATGYIRTMMIARTALPVKQVRYDPLAKRHVLFTEVKRRRLAEAKAYGFGKKME